jgi:hypothetical protein
MFAAVHRTRLALGGQSSCASVCPLLDESGQRLILAGEELSAFDPKQTLAVHCGLSQNQRIHGDANGIHLAFRAHIRRLRCDVSPKPLA